MRLQAASWLLVCLLYAAAGAPAQQYVFLAYRQPEGLRNLSINDMATDREGFLWLATENGLYRFLGLSFERYGAEQGIAEIDVRSLAVDADGSIWVGTEGNVYHWDGHRFQAAGKASIRIRDEFGLAVEDARHLLIVDNGRLYRLEHDAAGKALGYAPVFSNETIAAHPDWGQVVSVNVAGEPASGVRVWFGCGKRLCSWVEPPSGDYRNEAAVIEWGRGQNLPEDQWRGVLLDRTGTLWVGGNRHVAALPHGRSRFVDRTIPGSDPGNAYSHAPLIEDSQGRVLAPADSGVARWNGSNWQIIGRANGLQQTSHIAGMIFDRTGDMWFGAHGSGLYHWAGYDEWEGWTGEQGLPSAVVWNALPVAHRRVLVATDKGPAWISRENGAAGPLFKGRWSFGQVIALDMDRDGSLLAGALSGGVLRIDPKNGQVVEIAKLPSAIMSGVLDRDGRLFLGTRDGIWERQAGRDAGRVQRVTAVDALLSGHEIAEAGCQAPDGAVWFLAQNRLLRERGDAWTKPPIDGLPHLPGRLLALSCAGDGALWAAGEQNGVWRLTVKGDRLQAWQLPIPSEFHSLMPLAILADRRGWIWLGTDLGVLVWNGREWRHISQESGLIWNDVDQSAFSEDPDGSVWIGTSGGLSHLVHPDRIFDPRPIVISVTGIQRGALHLNGAEKIVLPWTQLPLTIQLSSPTIYNRSQLVFQYQMKGLHRGWIESQNGTAVFSGLPPGRYTFSARALNPDLHAVSETLEMQITILPPWWRTWWMLALYAFGLLLLLWIAHWLYEGHLLARSKELEMLISKRTSELEASRAQLRIQASHDELTGMLNRKGILAALATEMYRATRQSTAAVVALVDLDHFKRVNDMYGHLAGDEALRLFADAVGKAIRPYDHAGRYGGEEFLLVLSGIPPAEIKQRLINLHGAISNVPFRWHDTDLKIDSSAGVAVYDASGRFRTAEALLSAADQSLYMAKSLGRNRVIFNENHDSAGEAEEPREHRASVG